MGEFGGFNLKEMVNESFTENFSTIITKSHFAADLADQQAARYRRIAKNFEQFEIALKKMIKVYDISYWLEFFIVKRKDSEVKYEMIIHIEDSKHSGHLSKIDEEMLNKIIALLKKWDNINYKYNVTRDNDYAISVESKVSIPAHLIEGR